MKLELQDMTAGTTSLARGHRMNRNIVGTFF